MADRAPRRVVVAGSMGPTGEMIEPLGDCSQAQAREAFQEQAEALRAGGADVAWIETIDDTDARGKLALIYERMRGPGGTGVANIMKSQSLDPHSLAAHHAFYRSVMSG